MKKIRKDFLTSMQEVSKITGVHPSQLSRDLYVRVSVDEDIQPRVSGANLHKAGGFAYLREDTFGSKGSPPKVLVFDIETSPLEVYSWGLFDLRVSTDQIIQDWSVLSYSAKWLGEDKIYYEDTSKKKDPRDDKDILEGVWKLLDEADIVIAHNGDKFDIKKLNARFFAHNMPQPSKYRSIDTLKIAKRKFGFTSNKLSYLTSRFNDSEHQKSAHAKYPGFSLWKACLEGKKDAWKEMQEYNVMDVVSLEELAKKLMPWDNSINWGLYLNEDTCSCGSTSLDPDGFYYTNASKFVKYKCQDCGAEFRSKKSLKTMVNTRPLR